MIWGGSLVLLCGLGAGLVLLFGVTALAERWGRWR